MSNSDMQIVQESDMMFPCFAFTELSWKSIGLVFSTLAPSRFHPDHPDRNSNMRFLLQTVSTMFAAEVSQPR